MTTSTVPIKKQRAISRAKKVLISYVYDPNNSISGLAREIEIDRSNLHKVIREERLFLSGAQTIMFMAELYKEGLLDDAMKSIIGEGEECIFNVSSKQSQLESISSQLTRRFQQAHKR